MAIEAHAQLPVQVQVDAAGDQAAWVQCGWRSGNDHPWIEAPLGALH